MNPLLLISAAAAAGVAVWRRKSLKSDAEKAAAVAKDTAAKATTRVTSGVRASKFRKLGEAVYADRTDTDTDNTSEIDRLLSELQAIDAPTPTSDAENGESRDSSD